MTAVALNHIDRLIREMSLAEKLGQLTMTTAGYTVTGPIIAGDSTESIRAGTIGNLFNLIGADHVREMQRLAVEESRLGVPLLFGFDVIHGFRTMFPIPLAEAATFDPDIWTLTAQEAAKEAAADGLAMTFAPMLDVARDPRWGRIAEGPGEDPWLGARIAEGQGARIPGRGSRGRRRVWRRSPSTTAPTVRRPRAATTPPWTSRSAPCARCICRRSPRPWPPASRRSCPRSTISRASP